MNKRWGSDTRLNIAKNILTRAVDSLRGADNLEMALRIYGHQSPVTPTFQDCGDTKLEIPFSKGNEDRIIQTIRAVRAKGTTPIARSLEAAADDFPDKKSRNIIILITDGIEACDDEPCVIADKLRAKGITISPFVIGLGMDMSYLDHFDCYGQYSSAPTEEDFAAILTTVLNRALVNTTVQINLNAIDGKPIETDVTMFLYEAGTKNLLYTFTHTMNERGLPDTLVIDPSKQYDLYVETLPQQKKLGIKLKKFTHNIIEVDTPQGFLEVKHDKAVRGAALAVRVMQADKTKTLNHQYLGDVHKYIVGKYDVEVMCLPRRYYTVDINQSRTTTIYLEAPGTLNLKSATPVTGQIFEITDEGEIEWVCNLSEQKLTDAWSLQPGRYRLVYRKQNLKSAAYTVVKNFTVFSNRSSTINL